VIVEYRDGALVGPDGDVVRTTVSVYDQWLLSSGYHWCPECCTIVAPFTGPHCPECEEWCRREHGHCSEGCGSAAHVRLPGELARCVPCQQVADRGAL